MHSPNSAPRGARKDHRTAVVNVCLIGTLLVAAYAYLAGLQILQLNPVAAVPGMPLEEIWAKVRSSQGSLDEEIVPTLLSAGPVLGLAFAAVAVIWMPNAPIAVAAGYLALLALGAPVYFVASFSPGMNLADTFGINGGDYSPWAQPLLATSATALVALTLIGAVAINRSVRRRGVR